MTKPLLSASKPPKPTRTTQCLTNLLEKNISCRKRKGEERGGATSKKKTKGSVVSLSSTSLPNTKKAVEMKEGTVDVFGGIKSGSSVSSLGFLNKNGLTKMTSTTAPPARKIVTASKITQTRVAAGVNQKASKNLPNESRSSRVLASRSDKVATKSANSIAPIPRSLPTYSAPMIRPPPPSFYSSQKPVIPEKTGLSCGTIEKMDENKPRGIVSFPHGASVTMAMKRTNRDFSRFAHLPQHSHSLTLDNSSTGKPLDPLSQTSTGGMSSNETMAKAEETSLTSRIRALECMPKFLESTPSTETEPKENFVRLNLRNKNGACRGARKSSKAKQWQKSKGASSKALTPKTSPQQLIVEEFDAVDDFIDGVYGPPETKKKKLRQVHLCSGHQEPCKLLKVKKAGPNRGRLFYVCPCPRSEQCDHFQWADDTQEAARKALQENKSTSGFISRQVAAYMKNINVLTVPELRLLAQRHCLNDKGKKGQLLSRLSIWVRDEIVRGLDNGNETCQEESIEHQVCVETIDNADEVSLESSIDDSSSSGSEDELEFIGCENTCLGDSKTINDIRPTCEDDSEREPRGVLQEKLHSFFGHDKFRPGQEWAVNRCLRGGRSLLVAPTGSGKSLCYALPAALKSGVTIVVSPLLSLIEDQLRVLPPRLPSATLSGSMSQAEIASILDDVIRGRIKLLFVSPERLMSASFQRLFRRFRESETGVSKRLFPHVSLFCVDEAHCLSQWAHNFRPCYLRLGTMLELIEAESVLAITATAEPRVTADICSRLEITEDEEAVRLLAANRDNINVECLFMGSQEERLSKLIKILQPKPRLNEADCTTDSLDGSLAEGSVIVYVWRQIDAQVVAENIQGHGIAGGVVVYHGGMDTGERVKAQSKFMRGKCRICVATIAFGLGINKSDVVGVVHMHLSSSPEHYIQEIGRAGRAGQNAKAISLILHDEVLVRHSLAHSDQVCLSQCKSVLRLLKSRIDDAISKLPAHRTKTDPVTVAFPLSLTVNGCDCKAETTETILSLFEQREKGEKKLFNVVGIFFDRAKVAPKNDLLQRLAGREDLLSAILSCATCTESPLGQGSAGKHWTDSKLEYVKSGISASRFGEYSFSISECSNCMGGAAEPRHVFAALRRLQNKDVVQFNVEASPENRCLHIRMTHEGMTAFGLGSRAIDALASEVFERISSTVSSNSLKVLDLYEILQEVSKNDPSPPLKLGGKSKSLEAFQNLTNQYLNGVKADASREMSNVPFRKQPNMIEIAKDAQIALQHLSQLQISSKTNPETLRFGNFATPDYTSLSVTKFLHGLAPPSIPPAVLRRHPVFGRWQDVRFCEVHDMVASLFSRKLRPSS